MINYKLQLLEIRKKGVSCQMGQLSLQVLLFSALAIVILSAFVIWADSNLKIVYRSYNRAQALAIAEAGVEYYRWHLAHNQSDYQDGTGQPGPYVHSYTDKDGNSLGSFTLDITPPPIGSSVVTIKSIGKITVDPSIQRTIESKLGIASVIKYAVVANNNLRIENGTEVFGPVHANGGIRFDGLGHNLVTSARSDYDDPDHSGAVEFGVHTHISPLDPLPPSPVPSRTDIFETGRDFPVPLVDFGGLTEGLAQIKTKAQSGGKYFGPSGKKGYHIVLKTNDTFDLYQVTKLVKQQGCRNFLKPRQSGWGTWSINKQTLIQNYPFPANGLIFVEDNVWVNGSINTARLTIAAGAFPANPKNYKNIIINNDITYSNTDGQDILGLVAQGNVSVGLVSEDDLHIDGAVLAQNGRVGRYYYRDTTTGPNGKNNCAPYNSRANFVLNGMIATNQNYGFAYTDGNGYQARDIVYDANLLYNPPPSFPFISGQYQQISWREL